MSNKKENILLKDEEIEEVRVVDAGLAQDLLPQMDMMYDVLRPIIEYSLMTRSSAESSLQYAQWMVILTIQTEDRMLEEGMPISCVQDVDTMSTNRAISMKVLALLQIK